VRSSVPAVAKRPFCLLGSGRVTAAHAATHRPGDPGSWPRRVKPSGGAKLRRLSRPPLRQFTEGTTIPSKDGECCSPCSSWGLTGPAPQPHVAALLVPWPPTSTQPIVPTSSRRRLARRPSPSSPGSRAPGPAHAPSEPPPTRTVAPDSGRGACPRTAHRTESVTSLAPRPPVFLRSPRAVARSRGVGPRAFCWFVDPTTRTNPRPWRDQCLEAVGFATPPARGQRRGRASALVSHRD